MSNNGRKKGDKRRKGEVEDETPPPNYGGNGGSSSMDIPPDQCPSWLSNMLNKQNEILGTVKDLAHIPEQVANLESKVANTDSRVDRLEGHQKFLEVEQTKYACHLADFKTDLEAIKAEGGTSKGLETEVKSLVSRVAAAEAAPPPTPNSSFDRLPLPNVFKVSAPERFTKESLDALVSRLCFEAGLTNPQYKIQGPPHSKGYSVAFGGVGNLGKVAASQFNEARRDADEKWKPTFCLGIPVGDEEPKQVKVFFNPDASPKAERVAMLARKTRAILSTLYPDMRVSIRRSDSRVICDSAPCIQPEAKDNDHWELKFKGNTFTLDKATAIRKALASALDSTGGDEWF